MIVRSLKIYVTLIFSMFTMLCMAEEKNPAVIQIERDSIIYELSPKTRTAKLVDGKRTQNKRVIIPNTIRKKGKKYKVTEVGDYAFSHNRNLKSISIGDEVTRIGEGAFSECESLDSIIFSKRTKIDTICEDALNECYELKYMSLPKDFYSIARNDASIFQKFWATNHNSLKQGKYPDWFYQNEYVRLSDEDGLDIYYVGESIYVWLTRPRAEIEIIDSLCLYNWSDYHESPEGNGYEKLGDLNDTTELIRLDSYFVANIPDYGSWIRCKAFFIMVTPHKMQLIEELDNNYYTVRWWRNDDSDEPENEELEVVYKDYSCSISDRKTNGFYEIDVETVEKMYDDDDGKEHVTSSTSWVLYYDGEEFVRRDKNGE